MDYETEHLALVLRVIARENFMRRKVYPARVAKGAIPQSLADEEIRVMQSVEAFIRTARHRGHHTLGDILGPGASVQLQEHGL